MSLSEFRPCPECGGPRIPVKATVTHNSGSGEIYLEQPRRNISIRGIFKGESNRSPIQAITCIQCGYTAFFATKLGNLMPNT